jgi:hypothetical protein
MKTELLLGLVLAMLPILSNDADATGYLSTHCDGTAVTISLEIFNDLDPLYDGLPIIFKQRQIGTCAAQVELVTPELLMPAYPSLATVSFVVTAPQADLYYSYSAYVVLPGGTHQYLSFATHESGCGQAIAARGYLTEGDIYLTFMPCGNTCWDGVIYPGGGVDASGLDPSVYLWAVNSGIPVDLYGDGGPSIPMPGSPELFLSGLQPTPGGDCDAVGEQEVNWGSFKAQYR